jgi:polysaccharide deacetylase 2 family uncharacterized protein YibQ
MSTSDKKMNISKLPLKKMVLAVAIFIAIAICASIALNGSNAINAQRDAMPSQTVSVLWPVDKPATAKTDVIDELPLIGNSDKSSESTNENKEEPARPLEPVDAIRNALTGNDENEHTASAQEIEDASIANAEDEQNDPVDAQIQETQINTLMDKNNPGKPIAGLSESTQWGILPVPSKENNLTPFNAYKRPITETELKAKHKISITVSDMGLSQSATEAALRALPPEVSLSFSPYAKSLEIWATETRSRGHETWLNMPMEVQNYPNVDPGPYTLLIGASEKDNLAKLYWTLGRMTNYAGIISPQNATFIKSESDARPILTRIFGRGLGFVDGTIMPSSYIERMANGMSGHLGQVDVWIDDKVSEEIIRDAISQAEKLAIEQGAATIVVKPYPLSFHIIQEWIKTFPEKNMTLVPLSALTK